MSMTVYVGPTFKCPGVIADLMGLREGQQVAHMTADTHGQMITMAAEMGLPDKREMGAGTVRGRYIVTALERNRLLSHMGAKGMTALEMAQLETARAVARQARGSR